MELQVYSFKFLMQVIDVLVRVLLHFLGVEVLFKLQERFLILGQVKSQN